MVSASRLEDVPRPDLARPDRHHGHPNPALVHLSLSAPQGSAVGFGPQIPAVVAAEQHQCLGVLSILPEGLHHLPDSLVQMLDERHQPGPLFAQLPSPLHHSLQEWRRRLGRSMGGIVGKIEEKRLVAGPPLHQIVDRPLGEKIGGMPGRLDRLLVETHAVHAAAGVKVIVVHPVAQKAVKQVESALVGEIGRFQAQMPLADQGGVVTGLLQQTGQQRDLRVQVAPIPLGLRANVSRDSYQVRIPPAQQSRPGWSTDRRVGVKTFEVHARFNQGVDMGRQQILRAGAGQIPITQIVHQDQQDVGRSGGLLFLSLFSLLGSLTLVSLFSFFSLLNLFSLVSLFSLLSLFQRRFLLGGLEVPIPGKHPQGKRQRKQYLHKIAVPPHRSAASQLKPETEPGSPVSRLIRNGFPTKNRYNSPHAHSTPTLGVSS